MSSPRSRWLSLVLVVAASRCAAAPPSQDPAAEGMPGPVNDAPPVMGTTEPPQPVDVDVGFVGVECDGVAPVPAEGRLLTRSQYDNAVRDLFGGRIGGAYGNAFPPENQVLGFSTNSEFHRVSPLLAERHLTAAEQISSAAVPLLAELLPCSVSAADEACALSFIEDFGTRAFRRPLEGWERDSFLGLYQRSLPRDGFEGALRLLIQAFLQAPQFLYRLEVGEPATAGVAVAVSGYELATRLSFLLWNTIPDDALLEAAGSGALSTAEGLGEQARRMLGEPKARDGVADFYRQWLRLDRLKGLARDLDGTPTDLGEAFRSSLESFTSHVFANEGGNLAALFTSKTTYLSPELAPLYGVAVPEGVGSGQFFAVELEPEHRAGLLTQPGLMALLAHPTQSAPIQRGVFVREAILCQPAPPPPPTVNNNPPDPDPSLTTRERFKVHTEDPECSTCHQLIDPIGLGFEAFDQLGRYRETENGLPVDSSGGIVGVREDALQGPFADAAELAARLGSSVQVRQCLVTQWYRYGMGRVEGDADVCSMKAAFDRFSAADGDMTELLIGLVTSDGFRYRSAQPPPAEEVMQ